MAPVIIEALLKGGVGKATTPPAPAEAAALSVPVVLVDTDPRRTADLPRHLRTATRGAGRAVVDSLPPGGLAAACAALDVADRVVLPRPPKAADLDRVADTAEMAYVALTEASAAINTTIDLTDSSSPTGVNRTITAGKSRTTTGRNQGPR
jgi:hypothetical protein